MKDETEKTYAILWHYALSELEEEVNKKILEGWIPCGGICVGGEKDNEMYYQAVMKLEYRKIKSLQLEIEGLKRERDFAIELIAKIQKKT